MTTANNLTTINFHGARLLAVAGETPMDTLVAMKPVVEGMGLDWSAQRKKISRHPVLSTCMAITATQMPGDGQSRDMVFLPLSRLNFWLATVQPNMVSPSIRSKVIEYQIECADVLFSHFFGKAQSTHQPPSLVTSDAFGDKVYEMIEYVNDGYAILSSQIEQLRQENADLRKGMRTLSDSVRKVAADSYYGRYCISRRKGG